MRNPEKEAMDAEIEALLLQEADPAPLALAIADGLVHRVWVVVNPDKLASIGRQPIP